MQRFLLILFICWFPNLLKSQTATFITISSGGQFDRVTIGPSGCTSTTLNLCNNFTGSALSIALDGNILYIVDNKGFLYKNILTNTGTVGNCTKLGQFAHNTTGYFGLTIGPGGIVYAAYASDIETYNPNTGVFAVLGTLPNSWAIGGDMLFYQGKLYEAVKLTNGTNALIQVNLTNVSNSILYMNFNAGTSVFGFASVTVPCSNNAAYALSTVGSSTDIYAVDMISKTQAATASCTLPFKVNDAASIAETQSATPPSNPVVTSPFNICQGDVINFPIPMVGSVKDTLKWYTQAAGGSSYGTPTPKVDSAVLGTTTYYVSAFDTSTGCETPRQTMVVSVNQYPAVPTINPKDSVVICTGSNATLTSSAATGNQWNLSGSALSGATNTTYTTSVAGNYTVTATTNKGCSKTSTITKVIVTDTIKSTTNLTICQSQIPYTWNGLTFNSAGTQTKTGLKTVSGCDSSARLLLSIATVKIDTLNLFDCDSVYYKGVWYSYPTTIYDTLKAVGGCDSVDLVVNVDIYTFSDYAYIANHSSHNVSVIECKSNKIIATIPVGGYPEEVAVNPNGKRVYIANTGTHNISVINTTDNTVLTTISTIYNVHGVSVNPNGQNIYATSKTDGKFYVIDAISNTISSIINTPNGPYETAVSSNGLYAYVTIYSDSVSVINLNTNTIVANIRVGKWPSGICTSNDGKRVYVACQNNISFIDALTNSVIDTIAVAPLSYPEGIVVSKDGLHIYIAYSNTNKIYIYNTTTKILEGIIAVQKEPSGISFSSNEKYLYVNNSNSNTVSIIDVLNKSITTTVSVNDKPSSIGNFITKSKLHKPTDTLNLSSCSSITYKSKIYTSSTSFTDTTKSYRGCDSVYTLVNISITSTPIRDTLKHLKACNQLVYKGNTYTTSTIILDSIVKTTNGSCDSVYHYAQIIITPITATTNTTNLSNCKSIIYKGNTYTTSTIVRDTIKSYQGCDSIYNVANIVITPVTSITNTTNLSNCKSIIYNGSTYSTSTVVNDTIKSYQGCDSIYNVANIVITPVTPITNTTNLNHCNKIVYNGNNYTASAVIKDTVRSLNGGCDSVYNITNITINPIIPANINLSFSDCKQVIYKGNTYTTSTVVSDTVKSFQGCDSIYNVANIVITPVTPITNTTNLNHCNKIIYNGNTYATSSVVRDTLKSYQGCDSIYNVANIVITPVTATTNTLSFNHCKSITYKGITYTSSTTVRDTVKSYQGCDSIYNVANIVITPVTPTTNTTNLNHCNKIIYNSYTYTSSTVVRDTVRSLNGGCDSVYNITNININPITPTNINLSFSDCKQVVYKGKTYTSSAVIKDTTKSYQGCDSIYTVATITIKSITSKTNIVNLSHCKSLVYNAITYTSSTTLRDTIKSVQGCDSVYNIVNITISPINATNNFTILNSCDSVVFRGITYYSSASIIDTFKSYQGCDSVYNIANITIYSKPTIAQSADVYVLPNTSVTLKPVANNAYSFDWFPPLYLDDPTVQYPLCTPLANQTYHLTVTSNDGCTDTASVRVILSQPLEIPNVFSPNGDGQNDNWDIKNLNTYPQHTVQIFNRYGQLVYSSFLGSYKSWNGKYNGNDLPVGVYYYLIKPAPTMTTLTGTITILR